MSKHAIILAGGKGTRLRPYTVVLPKPLMPIGDFPILEVIIKQLVYHGFNSITLAVNHQADLIKAFFGNGAKWNVKIEYSIEDTPLGTMGPLKLIDNLPDDFLVMNGDVLTNLSFSNFFDNHTSNKRLFTISSFRRKHFIDYGVLETCNNSMLTGFVEKPEKEYTVSMGVYMLNKDIISFIPNNQPFGFDNLMLKLLSEKKQVSVQNFNGYWLDIGRPDDYMEAIEHFDKMRNIFINV
jgi:NDP-sugar pyrophosphorylase family protein